jgi:hypothetical protein
MNKGLWIARKNYLYGLIKKISDSHGGDDDEDLDNYFQEVIEAYPGARIEEAIACFTDLAQQLRHVPHRTKAGTLT